MLCRRVLQEHRFINRTFILLSAELNFYRPIRACAKAKAHFQLIEIKRGSATMDCECYDAKY